METNFFMDKNYKPNNTILAEVLCQVFNDYNNLLLLVKDYQMKWSFTKSGGWTLKVYDAKKALFYLIPHSNSYTISLTIRENERNELLGDSNISFLKKEIENAKKYSEGYHIQLFVHDEDSSKKSLVFLTDLMSFRK
ncbi:DUF3788 family protein [Holdemania massiliensis]|uniref:DUF3788 family protein n=1 Tax=Holdemania massiliensis TaxID=1468449 RepID=UPI001F057937|nr:DUF3788 family protein [Holdemania massiliensis]MCH1939433.1 DUF3788 domain-containing protein [Holdemania massiliensis]